MTAPPDEHILAVVVPVFNRPTLILRTLDSVMAQTSLPELLVIVDDGSTDSTFEVLTHWIDAQSDAVSIRLERTAHAGVAHARNHALALIEDATLVAFLDSDDVWPLDFLARTRSIITADRGIAAVSVDQIYEPADGNLSMRDLSGVSTPWLLIHGAGIGSATLFRLQMVAAANGYDETIVSGADFKLFLEVSLLGRWLHASGAPVRMLRGHGVHGSDDANLSLSRPDNWAVWAQIASEFVVRHAGQTGLSEERVLQMISSRWHDAARNLVAGKRYREACAAYEVALRPHQHLNSLGSV